MPPRTCLVTVTDCRGIRHTAEVRADSLFEAAGLAIQAFRATEWVDDIGPATRLEVEVKEPAVRHTVTLQQLQRWVESTAVTPADRIQREKLKALLGNN